MKTLVWVEHDGAAVKDATLAAVTAASQAGRSPSAGRGPGRRRASPQRPPRSLASARSMSPTTRRYGHALAENVAPLIVELMGHHDAFVAPATTTGKNIAPRVAALLDVMQISDILSVESDDTFTRPIYAGNAIATVQSTDAKKVITVRGTAFDKAATRRRIGDDRGGRGDRRQGPVDASSARKSPSPSVPELTSAKIIVSGGRALRFERAVPRADRSARRQARRRRRREPRGGRCGLCAQRLSGRPDRQDRRPGSLYRGRHLRRDPASGGHEGQQDHHRHQQGRGRADLPGRGLSAWSAICSRSCRS